MNPSHDQSFIRITMSLADVWAEVQGLRQVGKSVSYQKRPKNDLLYQQDEKINLILNQKSNDVKINFQYS